MCQGRGGGRPFLCPEGTRFNQRTFVCDHAAKVKCDEAANFFHRNVIVHEASIKATPKSAINTAFNSKRDAAFVRETITLSIGVRHSTEVAFTILTQQPRV